MTSVYASSDDPYDSGYNHGCDDADLDADDRYINEPGKGPSHHTERFMDGYNAGFDSCGGGSGGQEFSSSDDNDETGTDDGDESGSGERYYDGLLDWREACNDLDSLIPQPCSDLVTPDGNALTAEGKETAERLACRGGALVMAVLSSSVVTLLGGLSC